MKQKILFLIFIAIFGIAAKAQTIVDSGDGWSLDSEGVLTVTKNYDYTSASRYPWYASRSDVKSVVITQGVTSVGNSAFSYCSSLTSVTIPSSVTSVGNSAFSSCSSLTSVTIPSSVTSIGSSAFSSCSSLTSVTIPSSVTSVGYSAFSRCSSLTCVTISEGVKSIGGSAFYGCENIQELHIGSVESWYNISFGDDYSNPLYSASGGVKLYIGDEEVTELIIPDGVTAINDYAFRNCSGLTSVTIPEGVISIGNFAFRDCSGLTSVTIPSSVTGIGNSAFYGCSSLTIITIPEGVTSIGNFAFRDCSGLTSVTIPSSVTGIGNSAFYGCSSLTSVTIQEGVESIGSSAFSYCSSLTSVTIPSSVERIGGSAFSSCRVEELHIGSVKSWCNISFGDVYYSNPLYSASGGVKLYIGDEEVTELIIPDGVTAINSHAFSYCSSLTSITIQEGAESIDDHAFYDCSGLMSVTIPSSVTSIGSSAFYDCSGLTSVTIPSRVTSIGDYAFYGCSGLTSVTILSKNVEYQKNTQEFYSTFVDCKKLKYVFLYQESIIENLTGIFRLASVERFFVPYNLLEDYRSTYPAYKFTGFSNIEHQTVDGDEEIVALSLEKGSYNFIAWAVNSGEQVREGEEISIALTEDFDLDADNVAWQTLGTAEHPFKGIFEGNNFSIIGNRHANVTQPNSIFGYIGEGAEIRNVVFSDFVINATPSNGVKDENSNKTYYSLIARNNKGVIRNCVVKGRIEIDANADAENIEACLVVDNEDGELDHVVGYFEGLDGEVTGNKTSIIVIQNIGHGRTRGHSKKTASNGKKKSKGNSTVSAEVPDDINLNYRLFTDEEFAGAEPAYWLNFDGEGYTGTFNGEWTQGTKHPVLAKGEHGATVGVKYNVVNRDESVIGPSPVFFATSKSSLEVEYSEKPLSIEVNGMEINASQIGDMKAKFSLASVDTDKGNVNVVLKYEKQSTPTAVDDIDAAGSQKTIKTVENGRVVIIRDGKKYDLAGRVLSDKF